MFGSVGGAAGSFYLLKSKQGQKLLYDGQAISRSITVNEDSAVIDVVKQAGPAVVSIVISKDLNKIPGYGLSPFDSDPFFNFFYGGSGSQNNQQSSKPNVQEIGAGSGFLVSADGLILTNKHVVSESDASYTVITSDGKKYDAKVMAEDPVNDFAIVKIDIKDAHYLKLADSSKIQTGQRVVAIGNSLGQYQNTVTTGIISGIGRKITAGGNDGSEQLSGVIQTDAAINPGNSGGPLLNLNGEVVGINTAIDQQGQLVGFAIPANDAVKALDSFNKNGKITRAFLGVRYLILTKDLAAQQKLPKDYGALIVRGQTVTDFAVQPGSPADKAGLMENDIILEVNGKQVNEDNTLTDLLKDYNVGDSISLKVYHKGDEKTVNVVLGESK
ncbi:MAG: trypsin-like peptidase domain-containing protein [Candidatus Doudnabacteria bacterium]|nr:trypsin-like peptidase domain-containing protein [Candidatus Doudnabacteria bacterium]